MSSILDRLAGVFVHIYELLGVTGRIGGLLLVLAWLVVSFTSPSHRRAVVEWFGACSLYLALASLFTNLAMNAREANNTPGLIAFGSLLALFVSGLVVSLVQMALAIRSPGGSSSVNATH
jgi:hypothetical protein